MGHISPVSQLPVLFIHQVPMRCNVPREGSVRISQVCHQDTPLVTLLSLLIMKSFCRCLNSKLFHMHLCTWSNTKNHTSSLNKIPFHLNIYFHSSPCFPLVLKEWLIYIAPIKAFQIILQIQLGERCFASTIQLWCFGEFWVICHTVTIIRMSKFMMFLGHLFFNLLIICNASKSSRP